jgi:hypothetical protein
MSMLRAAVLLAFASTACSDDSGATPDLSTCSAHSIWRADGTKSQRVVQWSAPSGGEPKAFWPDKSPAIEPAGAWSDVPGSWVLYAVEPFSDGQSHLSVWSADTGGQARRLGCDPVPAGPGVFASSGALSPDAVFVAVQRSHDWQFVRVPRS